jgi:rfaE bifunctional protein nucleotidyltransferase chain/domain
LGEHITLEEARARRIALHAQGRKLVFTNGHFDLLHVGHLDYLEKARALGDTLYVGVNGDASTIRLKGAGRPLIPAVERARLLAALVPVSAAIIFEEDTADAILGALQPDIYVKGEITATNPCQSRRLCALTAAGSCSSTTCPITAPRR